ncbi:DNA-binding protein [Pelomonas sp. APW6]|uniref:DNA-binding protein n=1 Tax=Roseateles subflavus TaxID=3053353 RepID=A0ABT7LSI2_9BURK|nr:DNA-binding protein [Pelomonas sp. APW6]MDL5034421.1 DNA-binding protein [Pelomonas sp. APW6]
MSSEPKAAEQQVGPASDVDAHQVIDQAKALWDDLAKYARTQTFGDYPKRYAAIQDYAFRHYVQLLNAKQLRELAGGGSQTTAQAAIVDFRAALHRKVKFRLDMGDEVPEEFAAAASDLVTQIWSGARREAHAQFEEDRRAHAQALGELRTSLAAQHEELQAANAACRRAEQDAAAAHEQLQLARDQVTALALERGALTDRVASLTTSIEGLRAEAEAAGARHADQVQELQDRLARQTLEHRESLHAARRAHEATETRLLRERDAASLARETAVDERVEADLARARAEQALAEAIARRDQLANELESAKGAMTTAVERAGKAEAELASSRQQHQQQIAQIQEQAFDYVALLSWLDQGGQGTFEGLGKVEVLVARSILAAVPKISAKSGRRES